MLQEAVKEQVPKLTAVLSICANSNFHKIRVLLVPFLVFVGIFVFFSPCKVCSFLFDFFFFLTGRQSPGTSS